MELRTRLLAGVASFVLTTATAAAATLVADANLNVRSGPGIQYSVIAVMPDGVSVNSSGCQDGWCDVDYLGHFGWASSAYLTGAEAAAPSYYNEPYYAYNYAHPYDYGSFGFGFGPGFGDGYSYHPHPFDHFAFNQFHQFHHFHHFAARRPFPPVAVNHFHRHPFPHVAVNHFHPQAFPHVAVNHFHLRPFAHFAAPHFAARAAPHFAAAPHVGGAPHPG